MSNLNARRAELAAADRTVHSATGRWPDEALDRLTSAIEQPPTIVEATYTVLCELVDNGITLDEPISVGAVLADVLTAGGVPVDQWPPDVAAYLGSTYRPAAA